MIGWLKKKVDRLTEPDPLAQFNDDEIRSAALDIVWPLPEGEKSWIGGTVAKCDNALARIAEKRRQFSEYQPRRMREAIISWLDFAEQRTREAREDCLTQASKKHFDEVGERMGRERRRTREVHGALAASKAAEDEADRPCR